MKLVLRELFLLERRGVQVRFQPMGEGSFTPGEM